VRLRVRVAVCVLVLVLVPVIADDHEDDLSEHGNAQVHAHARGDCGG
jgi:hypothetical protein